MKGKQSNAVTQYALAQGLQQSTIQQTGAQEADTEGEPLRGVLMEAIQGSRTILESKVDTVAIEVGFLHADLCKVLERISVNEQLIGSLGREVASLKEQIVKLTAKARTLRAGRSTPRADHIIITCG
ncbi:hypothetical protein NDU88_001923 [Pleurodeles waltl]|uniref:Uncharacterized protein n=1 Tax=Pleurodeles waltl TaxID=8319 RepID=A0AAV7MMB4_PLEWA|nr:hypothetical protein NDU88_001923 [Pleurodeles waltl]